MPLNRKDGAGGSDPRVREARPFRILALDPGGTTGFAAAEWIPPNYPNVHESLISLDQIRFQSWQLGPNEHHQDLWNTLMDWNVDPSKIQLEIVYESFEFRQHINANHAKTKVELVSKEYIGIIKLFSEYYDVPIAKNTASAAKTFIPDKGPFANQRLKQLGVYEPVTHNPHAMDAMRHLLRYMVIDKKMRSPITDAWL